MTIESFASGQRTSRLGNGAGFPSLIAGPLGDEEEVMTDIDEEWENFFPTAVIVPLVL